MTDLIERLRKYWRTRPAGDPAPEFILEAADEIERLQSECDEHAGAYRRCSEERAKLQAVVDRVGRLQGCCSEHTINDCLKYGCDLAALEDSGER
jgi:hypothetical protein